jgi:hypothetical protein
MSAMLPEHGDVRTTTSAVTFAHSFRLGSDPRDLPPGTYTLHTDERLFSSGDRSWSTRAEIVVEVEQGGHRAFRHVAPADLDRAVATDAARSAVLHAASENPDRGLAQQ